MPSVGAQPRPRLGAQLRIDVFVARAFLAPSCAETSSTGVTTRPVAISPVTNASILPFISHLPVVDGPITSSRIVHGSTSGRRRVSETMCPVVITLVSGLGARRIRGALL